MSRFLSLLAFVVAANVGSASANAPGDYVQVTSGAASFTQYSGCAQPACGFGTSSGYTAAINQLTFGAPPGVGPGDACGRCFALTAAADPYSPNYTGPFGKSIIVKVTDECPVQGNEVWCGQSVNNPANQFGQPFHFDICADTGAADVFFPSGHGALTGNFTEVPCSQWQGTVNTTPLWQGACIADEDTGLWPTIGCGNQGTAPGGTTATPPPSPPATTISSPSTPSSSSSPTGTGTVAEFGQCGGQTWSGATACVSPFVCKVINPFYSQCLPA